MNNEPKPTGRRRWWTIPVRTLLFLVLAVLIGWTLNGIGKSMERSLRPAGFIRGAVQGALMPMAMPNLIVGKDVAIYSSRNTGVTYKLGYTMGVNLCGAIFFGVSFWRLSRWRRGLLGQTVAPEAGFAGPRKFFKSR